MKKTKNVKTPLEMAYEHFLRAKTLGQYKSRLARIGGMSGVGSLAKRKAAKMGGIASAKARALKKKNR